MSDINFIFLVLFFLVFLQSVVGVGILIIGTPFLLVLNFNIIDILSILLPISILTSLLNLIYFKFNKKKLKMKINSDTKRLFFFVCLPSIFVGLYLMEIFLILQKSWNLLLNQNLISQLLWILNG